MRNKGWSAIALAMVLPVMLFTASCAKKVVQTRTETQQVSMPEPEVRKAEVQKAPDRTTEKAGPVARPEEDRAKAESAAREAADWVFVNENIHFAFGSSLLSDEARQILRGKAEYLRAHRDIAVTVEGHCDDRGTNAYNVALGERRAESVKMFLVDLGIGTNRLNAVSYGEERPIAAGHDEASWARNRRAQFVIK